MVRNNSITLGGKEYKLFQPCPCDVCHDYRPAHICIYQDGQGVICDNCQRAQGIAHLNPNLQG